MNSNAFDLTRRKTLLILYQSSLCTEVIARLPADRLRSIRSSHFAR